MKVLLVILAIPGLALGLLWAWISRDLARQIPLIPSGHRRYGYRLLIRRAGHSTLLFLAGIGFVVEAITDEGEWALILGMTLGFVTALVSLPWWGRHDHLAESALAKWAFVQKSPDTN
jgi:hypothetical protein